MKLPLSLLLLISICNSYAQNSFVGIESGLSISNIFGNPAAERFSTRERLYGFTCGIQTRIKAYKAFGVKSGLYYERKGSRYTTPNVTSVINGYEGTAISEYQFDYFTLPLQLSFTLKLLPKLGLSVSSGCYASTLSSARISLINYEDFGYSEGLYKDRLSYRDLDLGMLGEVQFYAKITPNILISLGSKYAYGLYNVSKYRIAEDGTLQHKSLNINLGINYCWK